MSEIGYCITQCLCKCAYCSHVHVYPVVAEKYNRVFRSRFTVICASRFTFVLRGSRFVASWFVLRASRFAVLHFTFVLRVSTEKREYRDGIETRPGWGRYTMYAKHV